MSGEIGLFERGNVFVTDKCLYVLHRSFPLQSISDVEVIYHRRPWLPVVAPLLAVLNFELAALLMHRSSLWLGALVFMLVMVAAFWKGGLRYTIALETTSGYIRPMTSSDRAMVESLQQVLGTAVRMAHQKAETPSGTAPLLHILPVLRSVPGKAQCASQDAENAIVSGRQMAGRPTAGRPMLVVRKPAQTVRTA